MSWPDAERVCIGWARANTAIAAEVGQRISTRMPTALADRTFPYLTIQRVGGGPGFAMTPVDEALMQFDCWGDGLPQDPGSSDWAAAGALSRVLMAELFNAGAVVAGDGVLMDAMVIANRRAWEEETGYARFSLDVICGIRPLAQAL